MEMMPPTVSLPVITVQSMSMSLSMSESVACSGLAGSGEGVGRATPLERASIAEAWESRKRRTPTPAASSCVRHQSASGLSTAARPLVACAGRRRDRDERPLEGPAPGSSASVRSASSALARRPSPNTGWVSAERGPLIIVAAMACATVRVMKSGESSWSAERHCGSRSEAGSGVGGIAATRTLTCRMSERAAAVRPPNTAVTAEPSSAIGSPDARIWSSIDSASRASSAALR
mmetsp:Transcript_20453/g.78593  ORF Transcript_20453/g.78593 Transcript_20453/m.78593 type:complete len:233 (+) Transcript_20453:689-1387(+)